MVLRFLGFSGLFISTASPPVPGGTPRQKPLILWAGVFHKDTSLCVSERTRDDACVTFGIPWAFDNNNSFFSESSVFIYGLFIYLSGCKYCCANSYNLSLRSWGRGHSSLSALSFSAFVSGPKPQSRGLNLQGPGALTAQLLLLQLLHSEESEKPPRETVTEEGRKG